MSPSDTAFWQHVGKHFASHSYLEAAQELATHGMHSRQQRYVFWAAYNKSKREGRS